MQTDTVSAGGRRTTGRSFAVVCAWHLAVIAAFALLVWTWPEEVSAGGDLGITTSRMALAVILTVFIVVPGTSLSFAIGCGVLFVLRRRWPRSGLVVGTVAALTGIATVAAVLAIYAVTRH